MLIAVLLGFLLVTTIYNNWKLNETLGTNPGILNVGFDVDDTILFSQDNRRLNELLKLTETISEKYGLKLNRSKCFAIAMNNNGNIHFHDGTPLDKKHETTYLGNEINK